MNNKIIYLTIMMILAGMLSASGQARITEYYDYDGSAKNSSASDNSSISLRDKIEKIVVNTQCNLVYKQSNENVIRVYGDAMFRKAGIKVNNNTIEITEGANLLERIEIFTPETGIFILNGIGSLKCNSFKGGSARIMVNGMFDVNFGDIDVQEFNLVINGSSDFECKRLTTDLSNVNLNGMGTAKIRNTKASYIEANGNGVGNLTLEDIDTDRLKVSVNGNSEIKVSGIAISTTFILSGMGEIKTKGFKSKHVKKIDSRPDWMID